jgi:hypothetical protein
MSILVPVSTSDKVVSFSDHARNKFELGKITYEQFCNIEMLELGYNPNNRDEVEEYEALIESLSEEDFQIPVYISNTVFGPIEGEDSRKSIMCSECSAEHLVGHLDWEALACLECGHEIPNPELEL